LIINYSSHFAKLIYSLKNVPTKLDIPVKYIFEIVDGKDAHYPKLESIFKFFGGYLNCYQIEADDILNENNFNTIEKIKAKNWIDFWGEED